MDPIFDVLVLARWLHFGAMFALFGGALFAFYAPADDGTHAAWPPTLIGMRLAATVALLTGVAWIALTIVNMTGDPAGLGDLETLHAFFLETLFGPVELARMALLLALFGAAFGPMRDRLRNVAIAALSGLLLVSQASLGHAAEGGQTWHGALMIACYAVHVLAAAAWVGGLPLLLARIAELRRGADGAAILRLLSRYSLMATIAVTLVVASGVVNARFRVPNHFAALWPTGYGTILAIKVGLVAVMLGFAAYTRFFAMARLPEAGPAGGVAASIGCEIALGILVLGAAAVLGLTPPPSI